MVKLKDILSEALLESLNSAKKKYLDTNRVDASTFDKLKKYDPTPSFKYLEKIIEFYLDSNPDNLESLIQSYHNLHGKNQVKTRDINSFKSFEQFKSEVEESDKKYLQKTIKKSKSKKADIVFENPKWLVVIPRTEEASCKWGAYTKWCTTGKENNLFSSYKQREITLYYIISSERQDDDPHSKIAVAVYKGGKKECFDRFDESMEFDDILDLTGIDEEIFKSDPTELSDYEKYGLDESKITHNPDGSIDYDGDVDLSNKDLEKLPFNFRKVTGHFNCFGNNLKTLEGSPEKVGGGFYCSSNRLTSLNGAPKEVGMDFDCSFNRLASLEGAPKEVGGYFNCSDNKLTSLEGAPKEVSEIFRCSRNKLTSLKGAPKKVGRTFDCRDNKLESLEGSPKEVGWNFYCNNNNLTTLEGSPEKVGLSFECSHNDLETLRGAPKEVGGGFNCRINNLETLKGAPEKVGEDFYCGGNNLTSLNGAPKEVGGNFYCIHNIPPLPQSKKDWAEKNIKAKRFGW